MTPEARRKITVRVIANYHQKRGRLVKQPCAVCGSTEKVEKHHKDYLKPLDVVWLCRAHHLAAKPDIQIEASPE
jgi:hypothetical protein